MLIFNGKKYAKNNQEFVLSLFDATGTCNGYYKRLKNGVQLFNMQRELTAFIVDRGAERFVVNAIMQNGRAWYMHGSSDHVQKWLGVDFGTERDAIANMRFI